VAGTRKQTQFQNGVYTFGMIKFVYIQVQGVEKAIRIPADKVEKYAEKGTVDLLIVKRGDTSVGEFKASAVLGWWFAEESK
jgi:hypothetical protein